MFSMGTEVHSFEWAAVPSETQEKGLCSIFKIAACTETASAVWYALWEAAVAI